MGSPDLKSNIHKIIDCIENEQLLQTLYDFLKARNESQCGRLLQSLTEEQKKEVLLAYEESENDENLIPIH
jgi:hypothetical protein